MQLVIDCFHSSCMRIALSKWWNLYCSKYLQLPYILGWINMYHTYVHQSTGVEILQILLLCVVAVCISACLNGATCNAGNLCACPSTWTGPRCATRKLTVSIKLDFMFDLVQLSAAPHVRTVVPVRRPTPVLVHHLGLVLHAPHVSTITTIETSLLVFLMFSGLLSYLSKWWNMQCSQYLYLCHILEWF